MLASTETYSFCGFCGSSGFLLEPCESQTLFSWLMPGLQIRQIHDGLFRQVCNV